MKKLILIIILFMTFAGVAAGSSLNGDYKGNSVVKVLVDGKEIKSEVPAIIYDGSTLIPLRAAVEALGAKVTWDANTFTAQINSSTPTNQAAVGIAYYDYQSFISELSGELGSAAKKISINIQQDGVFLYILYSSNPSISSDQLKVNLAAIGSVSSLLKARVDGTIIELFQSANNTTVGTIKIKNSDSIKFANKELTLEQFNNTWSVQVNAASNNPITTPPTAKKEAPKLYSNDGKVFLGSLTTNSYDADSIYNSYGDYGSKYSDKSIWNIYGDYGSAYSSKSAFNTLATEPPIIIDSNGKIIGYLTTNSAIQGVISPVGLNEWLKKNGY